MNLLLPVKKTFGVLFFVFGCLTIQNVYGQTVSADTTFNGTGRQFTDFGTAADAAYDILLQNDGNLVAVGGAGSQGGLARYNSNGSVDTAFGTNGRVNYGTNIIFLFGARQTDGKILASGYSSSFLQPYNTISRFNADGHTGCGIRHRRNGHLEFDWRNEHGSLQPGFPSIGCKNPRHRASRR